MHFIPTPTLQTPIEYLKGVGPIKGDLLRKELQVYTFGDLLLHFPFRYIDRTQINTIRDINATTQTIQLKVKVIQKDIVGNGRGKRLVVTVKDATGELELIWFQSLAWADKTIQVGDIYLVFGKPAWFNGSYSITHPELEKIETVDIHNLPKLQPIYNTTEKLRAKGLDGKNIGRLFQHLLPQISQQDILEFIPPAILQQLNLAPRYQSLQFIHTPQNEQQIAQASYRLKFDELFEQQMRIIKLKLNHKKSNGHVFGSVGNVFNNFYTHYLPFALTDDQKKVIKEIRQDTATGFQMNRLLQGDVGSGKTIVALLCMLIAIDNGFQACLVAPTEVLCQQHLTSLKELLEHMPLRIQLLTGSIKGKERKQVLLELENGDIDIIVGTHALFEDKVIFKNLGIAIIDEQHRFGVAQRSKVWKKNTIAPHILVMTATPIPRTLAMTSYGDLDVSTITHLPPGRQAIVTVHRSEMQRAKVMDFLKHEISKGRQAYIVYPLIEESEKLDYENLMAGYMQVRQFFPEHKYNVCMVHGKQSPEDRENNMQYFVKGEAHIMVATTVIEVGVNVPNASVMVIESAERFGLSQLHQLRGRVGRGSEKSYCILLTGQKLSAEGRERMHTMVNETNGFVIAEKDLEMRGPGEIYGTKQSGAVELKIADLIQDVNIIAQARDAALQVIQRDADLLLAENYNLKRYLQEGKSYSEWSKIS